MKKNGSRVSEIACRVSRYSEISTDVWKLFKKYVLTGIDLNDFAADVHVLDRKYENNREEFMFMNKLLKVYFDELHRIKG